MLLFEEVYCEISRTINSRNTLQCLIYLLGGAIVTRGAPVWLCSKPWAVPEFQDNCCSTRTSYFLAETRGGQQHQHVLWRRNHQRWRISPIYHRQNSVFMRVYLAVSQAMCSACTTTVTRRKHIRLASFTLVTVSLLCKIIITS